MVAVVESDVHAGFGAGKEQSLAHRVFAHGVSGSIVRQPAGDQLPSLAAVVGAIDVGAQVVDAEAADRRIGGLVVKMRRLQLRDLAPGRKLRRRHVAPVLAAVAGHPDKPVVRARPNGIYVLERGSQSVNGSSLVACLGVYQLAHAGGCAGVLAAQVGTDDLPGISAVLGFEQHVGGVIHGVRVQRREHYRLGALGAVLAAAQRNGCDILHLSRAPVVPGNFGAAGAVNNVGIERVGSDIAILDGAHGVPVAEGDFAVVTPAQGAHGAAFLLPGANFVGEGVAGADVVELRRGLVVPGTPALAAIDAHDGALVADQQDGVRILGADPDVLVVIAAGRAANAGPGLAPVGGAHGHNAGAINHVGTLGINLGNGQVAAANAHGGARVLGDFVPGLAGIVGAVKAQPRCGFVCAFRRRGHRGI